MSKKLIVFGGSGFVGGNMAHVAQNTGWEVFIADTRPGPLGEWCSVDITDQASVQAAVSNVQPDAVVNVAAIADIDLAEQKKELACQVNVDGARFVAECCAASNIPYVFFSSDAVFDGESQDYREEDAPKPVNYYGRTKLEAEHAVLKAYPSAVVIRISLVLGFPLASGNAFLAGLHAKLKEGKPVIAPTFEIRTPVDVITLSECVLELCTNSYKGILHIGATDSISRYDLSCILARRMGFDEQLVQPQTTPDNNPARAPRHKNGIICVDKARSVLKTQLLSVDAGIERAFQEKPAQYLLS
jgi:dTDP-4-dehydrorhamnose reductase